MPRTSIHFLLYAHQGLSTLPVPLTLKATLRGRKAASPQIREPGLTDVEGPAQGHTAPWLM